MVQKIWTEILEKKEVRQNLSRLREAIKDDRKKERMKELAKEQELVLESLLEHEDPKTRKNAALLIGDLQLSSLQLALWRAYEKEQTLFVKGSYLAAMQKMDMTAFLRPLKERVQELSKREVEEENRKHIREEMQQLDKLILSIEGVKKHTFTGWQKESEVILLANRRHLDAVLEEIRELPDITVADARLMNAGIRMKITDFRQLMEVRSWQEVLFLVGGMKTCDKDPKKAAQTLADSELCQFLQERHKEEGPFYFRAEVKLQEKEGKTAGNPREKERLLLEEKLRFVKTFAAELEMRTGRKLINSTTDYELELRLVENKEGRFNVMVKLFTLKDERFSYRKEVIASSIRPVNAALLVQLSKEYMKEDARVLDPFCGVGTMLIERQKKIGADTLYGLDSFPQAIEKARRNTENAKLVIHYVNRDAFTFTHEYLFDEIFTNMPFVQGSKTTPEIYDIYCRFFEFAGKLVRIGGVIALYTHDKTYVDRLYPEAGMELLKKCQINVKEDTWLYLLRLCLQK